MYAFAFYGSGIGIYSITAVKGLSITQNALKNCAVLN